MSSTNSVAKSVKIEYQDSIDFAIKMDAEDPLRRFRNEFFIPPAGERKESIYLAGNSLGLQPRKIREYIGQELDDWAKLGVEGHFEARYPWLPYHENLTEMTARLVGAKPSEVVVMNTLTVNLHLMMVSFYRPTKDKYKIITEYGAFPSDQYAVASQAKFRGFNPDDAVIELTPRPGEDTLRTEDILSLIEKQGDSVALIMLGDVNYLTGQAFEVEKISRAAKAKDCRFGLNLAHGAGNLLLKLHDWDIDFAVWCSYKYLNSGPGSLSGCFVHERHATEFDLPRFAGWWGHNKKDRFKMEPKFDPIPGAEGWQLSNPPIFQLAALRASMEIFDEATMVAIREKCISITGYLEYLIDQLPKGFCSIITPRNPEERGSQLSIRFSHDPKQMLEALKKEGAICDFRNPDIIRAAPVPLYVRYQDVFDFVKILARFAS
ncbi:MAG TPA: kynureninase [Drouetiella sp.]